MLETGTDILTKGENDKIYKVLLNEDGPFPRKLILCKEDCTYSADLKNFHGGEGERDELLEAVLEQEDLEETAEEVTEGYRRKSCYASEPC